MAKLVYNFKSDHLSDFPVEFKLNGIDNDITVDVEITEPMWQIASMTGDLKTGIRVSMAADIAACDTILKIGAEKMSKVQRSYGLKSPFALNGLFKNAVESAVDKYVEACGKLADKLREEELK